MEVEEANLIECTSLSLYDSAIEKFNTKFTVNLILLVTERSEVLDIDISPLIKLQVMLSAFSPLCKIIMSI